MSSWTKSSGVTGEPFGDNRSVAVSEKNVLRAGGGERWGVRNVVDAGWSIPPMMMTHVAVCHNVVNLRMYTG